MCNQKFGTRDWYTPTKHLIHLCTIETSGAQLITTRDLNNKFPIRE